MRAMFPLLTVLTILGQGVLWARPTRDDPQINWQSIDDFAAAHGDLSGQSFTMIGPWLGQDQALFTNVLDVFEEATGAQVIYSGSDSLEQQVIIDTEAGSPPDIAIIPQPGLAADLADKGHLRPLGDETAQWLRDNYAAGESWVALGTYRGRDGVPALYAFPYKAELKSLVWYVPENLSDAGYEVPQTYEDLKALTEQIAADGETPWCIGLASGGATGWPGTDWVEDLMLRTYPASDYDAWVRHDLPFNDPKIVAAIQEFGWFARNDAFVAGGAASVGSTDFRDSVKGLFASPPACYLHHQASFIPSFFPEDVQIGVDADFFYFPARADGKLGQPVMGSGTMFAALSDNSAASAFLDFLKTPAAHEIWMTQRSFLTPHKGVNPDAYGDDTLRRMGAILQDATVFRFDGSDLMPGAIGAGAFWQGVVDFAGGASAQSVADAIQARWDALE